MRVTRRRGRVAATPTGEVAAANGLTAAWAQAHRGGNTALSAPGCWVLLALLASGAAGAARQELQAAIGVAADQGLSGARSVLDVLSSAAAVRAGLGLWTAVALQPAWSDQVPAGTVERLGGDPHADQQRLDRWVREATDGALTSAPIAVTADTLLALASALTVRTRWVEPFEEAGGFARGPWAGPAGHATGGRQRRCRSRAGCVGRDRAAHAAVRAGIRRHRRASGPRRARRRTGRRAGDRRRPRSASSPWRSSRPASGLVLVAGWVEDPTCTAAPSGSG